MRVFFSGCSHIAFWVIATSAIKMVKLSNFQCYISMTIFFVVNRGLVQQILKLTYWHFPFGILHLLLQFYGVPSVSSFLDLP